MTTIATDGKTMAGDGLVVGNGLKHCLNIKKVRHLNGGAVVGITGSIFAIEQAVAFLNGEADKIDVSEENFEALILQADGTLECMNAKGQRYRQTAPAVTGCGGAIALGAMRAGAPPLEAVKIAAEIDQSTGGECFELKPLHFLEEAA